MHAALIILARLGNASRSIFHVTVQHYGPVVHARVLLRTNMQLTIPLSYSILQAHRGQAVSVSKAGRNHHVSVSLQHVVHGARALRRVAMSWWPSPSQPRYTFPHTLPAPMYFIAHSAAALEVRMLL